MYRIFLAEDAPEWAYLVRQALPSGQYVIEEAGTVSESLELLSTDLDRFDLFLLDMVLPDGDGISLMKGITERSQVPPCVIFLTVREEVAGCVDALRLGADDYVLKPFRALELEARIQLRLRQRNRTQKPASVLIFDDLRIDLSVQKAYLRKDRAEQELGLTPIEFKILCLLTKQPGHFQTSSSLASTIWPNVRVVQHCLSTHVSRLRRKLNDGTQRIESVPRKGYRLLG